MRPASYLLEVGVLNEGYFQNRISKIECSGDAGWTQVRHLSSLNSISWVHPKDHTHLHAVATAAAHNLQPQNS